MNTRTTMALVAGIAVLFVLIALGPARVSLSREHTGDQQLAESLVAHAPRGANEVTAFVLANGHATHAGAGTNADTEVEVGSVTKMFTAELLRNAVDDGVITLDTTIGEITGNPSAPIADVTLEELATHTSGLPRVTGIDTWSALSSLVLGTNPYRNVTTYDIFQLAETVELKNRGEERYSNYGFALLGHLIARAQDTTYEELLREQIFEPLGMSDTRLATFGTTTDDTTTGRLAEGRAAEPWEMEGYAPAGAIRSTSHDMEKFARYLLDKGVPEYSWVHDEDEGWYWHNGGTGGYSSMLIIDPDQGRAAFANNNTPAGVEDMTVAILKEN